MNQVDKNKDLFKYDGLIYSFVRRYNYVKNGLTLEDGVQDGRVAAWQATLDFKKRCETLGWDNYGGAEYIFVKNKLIWYFLNNKRRTKYTTEYGGETLYTTQMASDGDFFENLLKTIPSEDKKEWLDLKTMEDKITEIIKTTPKLSKQYNTMVKYIAPENKTTINALCEIIGSSNARILKKKKAFFSHLLGKFKANEPEFIKHF